METTFARPLISARNEDVARRLSSEGVALNYF